MKLGYVLFYTGILVSMLACTKAKHDSGTATFSDKVDLKANVAPGIWTMSSVEMNGGCDVVLFDWGTFCSDESLYQRSVSESGFFSVSEITESGNLIAQQIEISADGKIVAKQTNASYLVMAMKNLLAEDAAQSNLTVADFDCIDKHMKLQNDTVVVSLSFKKNTYCDSANIQSDLYHWQPVIDKSPYRYKVKFGADGKTLEISFREGSRTSTYVFKKDNVDAKKRLNNLAVELIAKSVSDNVVSSDPARGQFKFDPMAYPYDANDKKCEAPSDAVTVTGKSITDMCNKLNDNSDFKKCYPLILSAFNKSYCEAK